MLAPQYPVKTVCTVLELPRSSYYHKPNVPADESLRTALLAQAEAWPTYGYRRLTVQLQREGWQVNHKRIQRLMKEMGLQKQAPPRKMRTTNSQHSYRRYPNLVQNLSIVRPHQVWVADITFVRLAHKFVYLAVIMDVFTRCICGWHLSHSLDQSLTLHALQMALQVTTPEMHHSDQGGQYAATAYVDLLADAGVAISMADVGAAWQNGYAERIIRTIKEEEIDLSDYQDFHDAYQQIGRFLTDVYNRKRIHSSLGYLTPTEFVASLRQQQPVVVAYVP
ncbi:IS3 family transposase [soil metagenome]